jgi:hypothetical protein
MSRSFARFARFFNLFTSNNYSQTTSSIDPIYYSTLSTLLVSGIFVGHCAYAIGTAETKIIKIKQKYTFDRNGFTEFMIIDENNKHYNVNNSFWYWKWDSIEDWHKIETSAEQNEKLCIKYYGWRVPFFGMFPNIIMSRQELTNQEKVLQLTNKEKEDINIQFNPYYYFIKRN